MNNEDRIILRLFPGATDATASWALRCGLQHRREHAKRPGGFRHGVVYSQGRRAALVWWTSTRQLIVRMEPPA